MRARLRVLQDTLPKSVSVFLDYDIPTFLRDLGAGVTVGFVALPLALAFAIASNVPPEAGLYCVIIAGFLISLFGGSRTQVGGPTGAFVIVVSGIVATHGLDGLYMCTMMAGVMLILLGVTRMGSAIEYIPRPVVIGFTNGIAILIASTQIKDFFGLRPQEAADEFLPRMHALVNASPSFDVKSTVLAALSLVGIFLLRRHYPRLPGAVLALLAGTVVTVIFALPVETIGQRFGDLPSGLPQVRVPNFRPELMMSLLSPALTIAMLGAIESLLSAVVADRMSGDRHNPNVELVAQGLANVCSPLAGGLPATGAIARTAANIRAGAQTPVAGIIHALVVLCILLFGASLARFIPLPVLASILVAVAWNMGEWGEIGPVLRLGWTDISVWALTFLLTVLADLTVAVEAGMILAALLYIRGVTQTTTVSRITAEDVSDGEQHSLQLNEIPDGVVLYRIHGPFLFGSTRKLLEIERTIPELPPIVIVRLRNMTAIDATGLHALERLAVTLRDSGRVMLLCGARPQPRQLMQHAEFRNQVGDENVCDTVRTAIHRARELQDCWPVARQEEVVR